MLTAERPYSRRAFALGGWIMLLFLLLIGLLIGQSVLMYMNIPTTPPPTRTGAAPFGHDDAYNSGVKAGAALAKIFIWVAPVVIPLITLGVAWVVGWVVSHMFGKSDDAGNVGAAVIMLGAIATFGTITYMLLAGQKNPPAAPTTMAQGPGSPTPQPGLQSTPSFAPPPSGGSTIPVDPPPSAPTTVTRPNPPAFTPPRPSAPPQSTFDAAPIIAEYQEPIDEAVTDLVGKMDKLLPLLAKPYPHEIRVVNERLTAIEGLRTSAEGLKSSLKNASDNVRDKLVAAGCPMGEAMTTSFTWAHTNYKVTPREFGADAIIRLCDKAKEEGEYLRDNIAKWTVDAKGEIKSKDIPFQQKAGSNRFFVKSDAERREFIKGQLQGK